MSLRRDGALDRRLEIPTATKVESFAPTMKSVSTDQNGQHLVPEFGRLHLSLRADFFCLRDARFVWGVLRFGLKRRASHGQADFLRKGNAISCRTHTNPGPTETRPTSPRARDGFRPVGTAGRESFQRTPVLSRNVICAA